MSCQHREDVCQHCLEKVQTTTEDAPPTKRVDLTTEKTMTARLKRNNILFDSSLLAAVGAIAYLNGKLFLKMASVVFDSILDTISTLTHKE